MRNQRGSGTLLLCGVLAVVLVVAWVGLVGGSYAVALHRTRGMADRAALAGARAFAQGQDPCRVAESQLAVEAYDNLLSSCRRSGDRHRYTVSVTVGYPVGLSVPGLPDKVQATAHAGPAKPGHGPSVSTGPRL